jgi:hypothetical protein
MQLTVAARTVIILHCSLVCGYESKSHRFGQLSLSIGNNNRVTFQEEHL